MTALDQSNVARLTPSIAIPNYQRDAVTPGIVHLGVGGFHRAHQAMYIDSLMNAGTAMDWGIVGVGVQPSNWTMRDALAAQDNLYTLVLRHNDGSWDPRVIGSLIDYLLAPDDPEAVIARLCDPRIRIVTLTATEGGYNIDPLTGRFDVTNESVTAGSSGRRAVTHDVRSRCRGSCPAAGPIHPGVHGRLMRQHSRQRARRRTDLHRFRAASRPGPGIVDRRQRPIPELDGRSDHATDHR